MVFVDLPKVFTDFSIVFIEFAMGSIDSPPARWGLLDFMSVACSSPPLLSSSSCSTATLDAQCSLSDLNHDHPRPVFPAGPQPPGPSPPSVPCRTSTTTIHAQCSLPDLNREYPRQVFPAGPHVGRYGTKNVQKKVRKNVRQVCYILLANSRVCGRVTGAMPLLTLQVAKFEAISLNRWQSLGWTETFPLLYLWSCLQRRLRQATSYSKLLQITWSDLMLDWCLRQSTSRRVSVVYHSYGGMVDMWHRNICWSIWALIYSIAGQRQDGHHHRRIQQEEVVWSVVSSCVFLFAWQVMAEGDQSADMFDRRCADMFGHVCLFGSGGPLACLVMFKQTCWELWSLLHMAHWHVYILFDRLTCTMTCQVKQMIGIVSWAKVPWQKLQTKVVSTSCFEMSWWGSFEAK